MPVVADGSEQLPTLAAKDKDGILSEQDEMRARGRYVFYNDVITILKGKRARGIWWARGRRIPQLPVLVHIVAMRASGLVDLAIGERIEAEVAWGPSGAAAYRLRRSPQARFPAHACNGIDRILRQLRRQSSA